MKQLDEVFVGKLILKIKTIKPDNTESIISREQIIDTYLSNSNIPITIDIFCNISGISSIIPMLSLDTYKIGPFPVGGITSVNYTDASSYIFIERQN
jgi:hypothetical protein